MMNTDMVVPANIFFLWLNGWPSSGSTSPPSPPHFPTYFILLIYCFQSKREKLFLWAVVSLLCNGCVFSACASLSRASCVASQTCTIPFWTTLMPTWAPNFSAKVMRAWFLAVGRGANVSSLLFSKRSEPNSQFRAALAGSSELIPLRRVFLSHHLSFGSFPLFPSLQPSVSLWLFPSKFIPSSPSCHPLSHLLPPLSSCPSSPFSLLPFFAPCSSTPLFSAASIRLNVWFVAENRGTEQTNKARFLVVVGKILQCWFLSSQRWFCLSGESQRPNVLLGFWKSLFKVYTSKLEESVIGRVGGAPVLERK